MRAGPMQMFIIIAAVFVLFVVFGPKNLPKLGKMLGSTMKEVRKGMDEATAAMSDDESTPTAPTSAPAAPVEQAVTAEPGRKVAKVVYEDEIEKVEIDPNRKVAKIIYEDEE